MNPRITGSAAVFPADDYPQDTIRRGLCRYFFGDGWESDPAMAGDVRALGRVFSAARVEHRQLAVNVLEYYRHGERRGTGDRMRDYNRLAYPLAREAVETALTGASLAPSDVTDLILVSCTGYRAPGLDVFLARDLGMPCDVRKTVVGHMGCYGAIVGLRSALGASRAYTDATIVLVAVELTSLHLAPSREPGVIAGNALFGDAAASLIMQSNSAGPQLIDTYCAADFHAIDQMTWDITDDGFLMGLSRRIPISLGRSVTPVVERLLAPHGLVPANISHWLIHPGGPDILEVVARKLQLSDEQMAIAWATLRDHGNCSSTTVLLMLNRLLQENIPRPGEWAVMMAFGPGLTLETCLLRF